MAYYKFVNMSLRLGAVIVGATLALPFQLVAQTSAASQDPQETIAALKAALAARDAEIAALKAAASSKPAAAAATPAQAPSAAATAPAQAPAPAANAPSMASMATTDEGVVKMSAFEVRTTQGNGYTQGNSASALKTSELLMNLPAQIIILSSDMIHDISSHNASDVLSYAGLVPYYRGPAILSRGSRVGNPYIDEVPQSTAIGVSDNTNIDTYQVVKGPQQALYPLASLGGLVLETTKKPLPDLHQTILDLKVTQWGRTTFTFDSNLPLRDVSDAKFTARVVGIAQAGDGPFYNSRDDRYGIFPSFSFDWKNTNVTVQYGIENFFYLPGGTGILTPTGGIYHGLGVRNQGTPPNDYDKNQQHDARIAWTQRLSDSWQVKSQATYFITRRSGTAGFPTTVNWNNNTMTYTIRKDDGWATALDVQTDVSGKYNIGSLPATSAFGFNLHDQTTLSRFIIGTPVTIPIGNAAAINSITFPDYNSYTIPANPGSRARQYVSNGYLMETIQLIPNRLTLAAGGTYSFIETYTDTNLALRNPFTATDAAARQVLHRYALVGNITKDVTAYVTESTTFTPSVGPTITNAPLPPVLGKSDEVGLKTGFYDGKISISVAAYKMTLTNQAILAAFPALNVAGLNYYIPIGSTTSKGWDASLALFPIPGLQIVGTAYEGTVHDQNGNPIAATVENSWSVFGRYDFERTGALKGWAFGGGAQKAGGKWFVMGGMVLPGGQPLPVNSSGNSIFKLKQEVLMNLFTEYELNKNWTLHLECNNVLGSVYAIGAQGVGLADSVDPRTFSFRTTYKF